MNIGKLKALYARFASYIGIFTTFNVMVLAVGITLPVWAIAVEVVVALSIMYFDIRMFFSQEQDYVYSKSDIFMGMIRDIREIKEALNGTEKKAHHGV